MEGIKPRIVRIITSLYMGGPALQSILLTASMRERGYDTVLICGRTGKNGDDMEHIAQKYNVEPLIMPELHQSLNPFHVIRSIRKLTQILRELQPDVVHTHMTTAGFIGRIAARLAGVEVVVHTMHVHPFRGYYSRISTLLFTMVERIGARLSDSLITLSSGLLKELTENYHITTKKRVTVLPVGFDLKPFADAPRLGCGFRKQWNIPQGAPVIGIVGRLHAVKNHELFLEAAAKVNQYHPDAYFVIVGDGNLRPTLLQQASALGIAERVIITGWQKNTVPIFSDMTLLVNSSLNEGTPAPIIEALAAGCPVVATRVGGIPDLLDGGLLGELVPSGDADALAGGIMRVMANPPDPLIAQKRMIDRYGIDQLALDLDSLYRGLLSKKREY